jgi:anthranilate phosphoribosyltransferase
VTEAADFSVYLHKAARGEQLSEEEAAAAFSILMSGGATDTQIGGFLLALGVRGESIEEITGAARVMREKALTVTAPDGAIDTCGTGGDNSGSFNVSTAAALVVAACGTPVAKHGNRAQSSKSGSADVLAALGVDIDAAPETMEQAMREANIGFLMAPRHHAAMRHVAAARRELGVRTLFNLVGPLANPANARYQLLGVFARQWLEPLAAVLGRLGAERAWVVHGSDGLDELTVTGPSFVAELREGKVTSFKVEPLHIGIPLYLPDELKGGDAEHNAQAISDLLAGANGAFRDIVRLNAAAALVIAGRVPDLKDGVKLAAEAIDSGAAKATLKKLVTITNKSPAA